ncbi:enoyl-CoA hydratase [Aureococcus anophagefferens]|nr:enoyl-CoA hydratase [Aureococcus anophagefferens]
MSSLLRYSARQVAVAGRRRLSAQPVASEGSRSWEFFAGDPEVTADGVAIVRLDAKKAKMNTLNPALQAEAQEMWSELMEARGNDVKAAVFISAKPDNFIAGADISMLAAKKASGDEDSLEAICLSGHTMFAELKATNIPIVAAIHGACLGGGLEWALKCDYRVASTSPKTKLGLPEVKLGLLPGWGGTYALPKLIGLTEALPMILQGKEVKADKAKKLGLVDAVCDPAALERLAVAKAAALGNGSLKLKEKKKSWMRWATEDVSFGRDFVFKKAKETVDKTTRASITASKKNRYGNASDPATLKALDTVAVLGAGLMGAGIAQVSAEKGLNVLLKDASPEGLAKGVDYVGGNLAKKVKRRRMTDYTRNTITSKVMGYHDGPAARAGQESEIPNFKGSYLGRGGGDAAWRRKAATADVVIEAVFEDLDLKHKVFQSVAGAAKPERVLGMHYFSPVPQMQLLEIIPTRARTPRPWRAFAVGIKQGKFCIEVKDVPGFYVNRCLAPMMAELAPLFQDGVEPKQLDEAILDLGMPVGPVTLIDEVGADVGLHVQHTMLADETMGGRMAGADPAMLQAVVDKGWLGRKSGKGFFVYDGKKKTPNADANAYVESEVKRRDAGLSVETIQDRYLTRFVNEAAVCLQEGILKTPATATSAPPSAPASPFTGGPFRMLDAVGAATYVDKMNRLADEYGDRFAPCDLLVDHANSGRVHPSQARAPGAARALSPL